MYIIAGLGNPTAKYNGTRHNIGFDVIDKLAANHGITMDTKKHKALCGRGAIKGHKVVLAKPMTYMNLSGDSIRSMVDFYKINCPKELIIIYDDINLAVGRLRLREKGSAGGHNGMKSIIWDLDSDEFIRIRIGIGEKPNGWDLARYVLERFDPSEKIHADQGIENAAEAIEVIITEGMQSAMNRFNAAVQTNPG